VFPYLPASDPDVDEAEDLKGYHRSQYDLLPLNLAGSRRSLPPTASSTMRAAESDRDQGSPEKSGGLDL